jgi:hypothetical protein
MVCFGMVMQSTFGSSSANLIIATVVKELCIQVCDSYLSYDERSTILRQNCGYARLNNDFNQISLNFRWSIYWHSNELMQLIQ